MESILNNDFAVSGYGRSELEKTADYIDRRTTVERIAPIDMGMISFLTAPLKSGSFDAVRIEAADAGDWLFADHKPIGKLVKLNRNTFPKNGITESLEREIFDLGFIMTIHREKYSRWILPSECFFRQLTALLGIKAEPGSDPIRDLYIASRMRMARPIKAVIREERSDSPSGRKVRKILACACETGQAEDHGLMLRIKPVFDAYVGLTRIGPWTIAQDRSSVDFITSEDPFRGVSFRKGYEFSFSDTFAGAYKIQPFVAAGGDKAYIGEPYYRTVVSSEFNAEELVSSIDPARLGGIDGKIEAMMTPVSDIWHVVDRLAAETGVDKLLGPVAYGTLRNIYSSSGDTGTNRRFIDAVLLLMQLPTLSGASPTDRTRARVRSAAGRAFEIFPEVLGEERSCEG